MSDNRNHKKPLGKTPKNIKFINGILVCSRCPTAWAVVDLNPELKVVKCPTCSEPNDIREAIQRGTK